MAAEPPPPPPPVNGIAERAIAGLGRGFDLTSDFKLKFCKGEERLVQLSETTPELSIPGYGVVSGVSGDIRCDKGDRVRHQSDVLEFHQMSELFNLKSSVSGKIPSGHFNSMFGFESGSWGPDARNTKCLGLDGYYIGLFSVHVDRYPLLLRDEVRNDVPSCWDPAALARFIEKYGTHIVVGVSVGGSDVVVVRQDKSSKLPPSILKKHLDDLADQLFTGGDPSVSSHCEWLPTVASMPDAIHFDFIPITSLLKAVPGKGFLSHAINLYLRYKPPLSDLQYFLDFQSHKMWAPIHNDLPLGPVRKITSSSSSLQLSVMGPKLYVNTAQVVVGNRPVTGMRFFLEGMKNNRLAIHLQHLSTTPTILSNALNDAVPTTTIWRSSDETPGHEAYLEPISGKKFSHVCTSPVTQDDPSQNWTTAVTSDGNCTGASYIVTGAQLHVTTRGGRPVLHLRLQFTKVTGCFIVQSTWAATATSSSSSSELVMASPISGRLLSAISGNLGKEKEAAVASVVVDSGVFPTGPPVPVQAQRMLKYVDTCQISRGPADSPGHWLVTGARLGVEKGKLGLQVKFSLLNIATSNSS
ncbi:MACPF domain-containing protein At4g24290 [Linum perenne]